METTKRKKQTTENFIKDVRRKEYQREILSQSFENQNEINNFESARNLN
jgi:hypothetical protein